MSNLVLMLGAMDPEMAEIETLAAACGVRTMRATSAGQPVTPATAMRADGDGPGAVWVECCPARWAPADIDAGLCDGASRIDHHAPGDPGYGRPPAEAVAASSLGQVIALLAAHGLLPAAWEQTVGGLTAPTPGAILRHAWGARGPARWVVAAGGDVALVIPARLVVAAAADHCLAAAYGGGVPGVGRGALLDYYVECQSRPVDGRPARDAASIRADLAAGDMAMAMAPLVVVGSQPVRDLRDYQAHTSATGFVTPAGSVPSAPAVASMRGEAFLARVTDRPSAPGVPGRVKTALMGAATPEAVAAFLAAAKVAGCETYGDPARGFAGAYGELAFPAP